jgi:hypothetical protein
MKSEDKQNNFMSSTALLLDCILNEGETTSCALTESRIEQEQNVEQRARRAGTRDTTRRATHL